MTSLTRSIEGASILNVLVITLLGLLAFLEPLHDLVSSQLLKLPTGNKVVSSLLHRVYPSPEWVQLLHPFP